MKHGSSNSTVINSDVARTCAYAYITCRRADSTVGIVVIIEITRISVHTCNSSLNSSSLRNNGPISNIVTYSTLVGTDDTSIEIGTGYSLFDAQLSSTSTVGDLGTRGHIIAYDTTMIAGTDIDCMDGHV